MSEVVVHMAGLAAFALVIGARVRSSRGPASLAFWVWTAVGLAATLNSPLVGLFAALIALLGADIRGSAYGALVSATAALGIGASILGPINSTATMAATLVAVPVVAAAGLVLLRSDVQQRPLAPA